MNLLCAAGLPWQPPPDTLTDTKTKVTYPVQCADTPVERIPYYVFAILMFGTTYFQQRQMQQASPPGAASQQQQALLKVMPLMFGVFGIFFPAGLVLYWTTSNAWQIGQQYFMLKSRPTAEQLAERATKNAKEPKKGFISSLQDRAEEERKRRDQTTRGGTRKLPPGSAPGGTGGRSRSGGTPTRPEGTPPSGRKVQGKGKPKPAPPPVDESVEDDDG
jgi:YidC/Oxa1 family membrane protein insertase